MSGPAESSPDVTGFNDLADYRRQDAQLKLVSAQQRREATLALQGAVNRAVLAFTESWVTRTLGGGDTLLPALEWFWFNHFNVFWRKQHVGAALSDYIESALRPNLTGRFRDLLLAVVSHPAMLVYLDNVRNVAGKSNENFARELLELHTLGVGGGYGQADVQEVARVLTGVGLRPVAPVTWPASVVGLVRENGEFMFDPRRHDFSGKRLFGHEIAGTGFTEVENLVDILASHPATTRHIATKLCRYFWGDAPPDDLVTHATSVFKASFGDIRQTVDSIQTHITRGGLAATPSFKSPTQWVMSSLRLLAGGARVEDSQWVGGWLNLLGQPLFGRSTPDGYSLLGSDWISSGQLVQRFEVAQGMVNRLPSLLGRQDFSFDHAGILTALEHLSPGSRAVVERAGGQSQRAALIICSPEFMYRRPGQDLI